MDKPGSEFSTMQSCAESADRKSTIRVSSARFTKSSLSTDNRLAPVARRHLDSRRFTKRQAEPPARRLAGAFGIARHFLFSNRADCEKSNKTPLLLPTVCVLVLLGV